ncbi:MAG: thioredoxin family protein [Pseudobdellovibrionaceae bacterium]
MALTFTPTAAATSNAQGGPLRCPDFLLPMVSGETFNKQNLLNGKPFVVMFICNHCPYVQAIEDRLIQLGHDLKSLGVNLVAICSNDADEYPEDAPENLHRRWLDKKYSFSYLHDESQKVAMAFGAVCTPDFFVFAADQVLAYRGRLDDSWKDAAKVQKRELFLAVESLLNGQTQADVLVHPKPAMGCSIKWKG